VLKRLKFKWLWNVQMRGRFASVECTGVGKSRRPRGVYLHKVKELGKSSFREALNGVARSIDIDPRGLYHK